MRLSDVREGLASPLDQSLHILIYAVSWVYDRTTDDRELQEFIGSIPGLLSCYDGQIAWRVFVSKSAGTARELEARISRLLKACAAAGYLDRKNRQLRATLCIDALLAISSLPEFFNSSSSNIELDGIIMAPWDDEGMLATKSVCAEAVLARRALLPEIPDMRRHYTNSGFRDLSTRADQGLRDIDDMRQILDAILQEPESFLQTHKADITTLLRVYFAVVESKTSVMDRWIEKMRNILPKDQHFPFLSWYYLLPPAGLQIEYKGVLAPSEKAELKLHVYQILAYLRLQLAYPLLSDSPRATSQSSQQRLSKTWFPLSEDIPLRRLFKSGTRTFKPFARGGHSFGNTLFTKCATHRPTQSDLRSHLPRPATYLVAT
ncbi:hypothetical protein C0991_004801 [Blastosporella zonata]|nr:hypothetical protein C0991_004801 [Blastosporella zonata]